MPTAETNRKLATLGIFVLPVVLVKMAGVFLGPVPAQAVTDLAPAIAAAPVGAGEEQGPDRVSEQATQYARALQGEPFGAAPLFYEFISGNGEGPIMVVGEIPPPEFEIGMILGSARGDTVLIDDQTYRVGDLLGETTWRIVDINEDQRSVTLADTETERTVTRFVKKGFEP